MFVKSVLLFGCLMIVYNCVNGEYMDFNRFIIDNIFRDEWKFEGLVMSDWGGINLIVESVIVGCDFEMLGFFVR